jgi:hypothetical protein
LGICARQRRHLLLLGVGAARRRAGAARASAALPFLPMRGAMIGARDLAVAAHGAADQGLLFLAFVGLAVLEPTLEFVALGAAQAV